MRTRKLTEFGVRNRALRNRIRPVSEDYKPQLVRPWVLIFEPIFHSLAMHVEVMLANSVGKLDLQRWEAPKLGAQPPHDGRGRLSFTRTCVSHPRSRTLIWRSTSVLVWGFTTGWFPKGWFWWMFPGPREPERGHEKQNDGTKNWNEGTFCQTTLLQNHPFVSSRLLI